MSHDPFAGARLESLANEFAILSREVPALSLVGIFWPSDHERPALARLLRDRHELARNFFPDLPHPLVHLNAGWTRRTERPGEREISLDLFFRAQTAMCLSAGCDFDLALVAPASYEAREADIVARFSMLAQQAEIEFEMFARAQAGESRPVGKGNKSLIAEDCDIATDLELGWLANLIDQNAMGKHLWAIKQSADHFDICTLRFNSKSLPTVAMVREWRKSIEQSDSPLIQADFLDSPFAAIENGAAPSDLVRCPWVSCVSGVALASQQLCVEMAEMARSGNQRRERDDIANAGIPALAKTIPPDGMGDGPMDAPCFRLNGKVVSFSKPQHNLIELLWARDRSKDELLEKLPQTRKSDSCTNDRLSGNALAKLIERTNEVLCKSPGYGIYLNDETGKYYLLRPQCNPARVTKE